MIVMNALIALLVGAVVFVFAALLVDVLLADLEYRRAKRERRSNPTVIEVDTGMIEVDCPTCEATGEVVHEIDCDVCAEDGGVEHAEPCPTCRGHGALDTFPRSDTRTIGARMREAYTAEIDRRILDEMRGRS